jgi:hypothetical protein
MTNQNALQFNADTAAAVVGHIFVKSDVIHNGDEMLKVVGSFKLLVDMDKDEVYVAQVIKGVVSQYPLMVIEGELVELTDHPIDISRMVQSKAINDEE